MVERCVCVHKCMYVCVSVCVCICVCLCVREKMRERNVLSGSLSVLQDSIEPVYFYIGVVFALQAVYVTALFICSWVMSGTWVAGMLAVAWFIINRSDSHRKHIN